MPAILEVSSLSSAARQPAASRRQLATRRAACGKRANRPVDADRRVYASSADLITVEFNMPGEGLHGLMNATLLANQESNGPRFESSRLSERRSPKLSTLAALADTSRRRVNAAREI